MHVTAAVAFSLWVGGCKLNRDGLVYAVLDDGGTGGHDGRGGAGGDSGDGGGSSTDAPVEPDGRVDRPDGRPDVQPDVSRDMGNTCDTGGGYHLCNGNCLPNTSVLGCGSSCDPCPVPANGSATCNGTICGIVCNLGFTPSGMSCTTCNTACDAGATTITGTGGRFTGRTAGNSTSAGSCGGGSAPEAVYKLTLAAPADVFATTHGTGFNTVLYMRRGGCCGVEVACNDDADGRPTSVLSQNNLPAGTYYIIVDGAGPGQLGNFTLDVYTSPVALTAAESCGRPARIANGMVSGNTCLLRDDYSPVDGCMSVATSAFDAVYYFVLDAAGTVSFTTCDLTCIDSVLYVRDVCNLTDSERICNDDACGTTHGCTISAGEGAEISLRLEAGVHYLMLDTYPNPPPTLCGPFSVVPSGIPP